MMSSRERQLRDLVGPSLEGLGYEVVGVETVAGDERALLRVFIDREGGITVGDCERASRQIAAVLDVEDPMPGAYVLEVSSPGLDRPLLSPEHFARFAGRPVRLRAAAPVDGRRCWSGRLVGRREDVVVVQEGDEERIIPLDLIEKANLVPEV